jgi:CRISPR/Cas system CMR-associated protein Cmr5 small subunit
MIDVDKKCLKFAWEIVGRLLGRRELGNEVLRHSRRAGSMVFSDGLPATLAFAYSRGREAWREVGDSVVKWLNKRGLLRHVLADRDKLERVRVFRELSEMEGWKLLMAEREAVRFLGWLARLCEGEFGEG